MQLISAVTFEVPLARTEQKALKVEYQEQGLPGKVPTRKVILSDVSGSLAPGTFTAIMGASGAGKTTLLNFLSNRRFYLRSVKQTGSVYLNGTERSDLRFNEYVAYVMQDDVLIECMTVRELLTFTGKLQLPADRWEQRMMEVVEQLQLNKILDTRVGGVLTKGISGGERKRVAIAMEILSDPLVLFLDEPTTGLDSYNAENVISMCTNLCKMGKTVCCTIHQPNSFIFSLFENLLILADKKIVFCGPHTDAVSYFASHGYQCPEYMNPAEYMIKILSDKTTAQVFPPKNETTPVAMRALPEKTGVQSSGMCKQFTLLCKRSYLNFVRNKQFLQFAIISKCFFLFMFLTAFWMSADTQDPRGVMNRAGFLSFFLTGTAFDAVGNVGGYLEEKGQYVREQANRTYSPGVYFLSKIFSELPLDILLLFAYLACIYAGVGLSFDSVEQIFIFILLNVIIFVNGRGWCFVMLFGFESFETSAAVTPFIIVIQTLFNGFFINYANIPKYLYELLYTSIFKYTWSAAMANEFAYFDRERCGDDALCDATEYFNIELPLWANIGIAVGHTIVVYLIAFAVLYRLSKGFRS